ncbi:Uncharacterized protein Fot_16153 [Forsythia ovata]|uniref:Uncharacterized protein n=1 Tax=Forsythia ovata TaxID=205694 RepID=A0ABD1WEV7_9LAMI
MLAKPGRRIATRSRDYSGAYSRRKSPWSQQSICPQERPETDYSGAYSSDAFPVAIWGSRDSRTIGIPPPSVIEEPDQMMGFFPSDRREEFPSDLAEGRTFHSPILHPQTPEVSTQAWQLLSIFLSTIVDPAPRRCLGFSGPYHFNSNQNPNFYKYQIPAGKIRDRKISYVFQHGIKADQSPRHIIFPAKE